MVSLSLYPSQHASSFYVFIFFRLLICCLCFSFLSPALLYFSIVFTYCVCIFLFPFPLGNSFRYIVLSEIVSREYCLVLRVCFLLSGYRRCLDIRFTFWSRDFNCSLFLLCFVSEPLVFFFNTS